MQTEISEASRLVETARREPLGMSFTRLTISMPWPRPAGQRRQNIGQRLARAFHARRNDAGSDHRGFQQAQIIAREIEDLGQGGDVGGGVQIDAGQAQHRLVDHAEVGLHGRLRRGSGAAHAPGRSRH